MYFVDNGSAVPVMPQVKPVSSATPQFFTEGGNGTPPTYPGPDWFNIFQLELLNVLKEAQINPDKANHTQLVTAMKKLFLDASSNGSDIPDKAAFLSNLGLGELALAGTITGVFDTNGYLKIPAIIGGVKKTLIIQWGQGNNTASATSQTSYPIPFPEKVFQVIPIGFQVAGNQQSYVTLNSTTPLDKFTWNGFFASGGTAPSLSSQVGQVSCRYIVIGW
ncbi:hypothetical protein [Citrobacter sp. Res13-Lact-LER2-35-b]|uniref:gp53-like domain-containing protein n=1 Tax=Citrobacter sp. Res13-Lact-LER2-35-b TaxID=2777957 RepID=UPI0018AA62C1|nr:hypothetical protein [Citrobacter sp. Res13-Lact-LER2-35-b]